MMATESNQMIMQYSNTLSDESEREEKIILVRTYVRYGSVRDEYRKRDEKESRERAGKNNTSIKYNLHTYVQN